MCAFLKQAYACLRLSVASTSQDRQLFWPRTFLNGSVNIIHDYRKPGRQTHLRTVSLRLQPFGNHCRWPFREYILTRRQRQLQRQWGAKSSARSKLVSSDFQRRVTLHFCIIQMEKSMLMDAVERLAESAIVYLTGFLRQYRRVWGAISYNFCSSCLKSMVIWSPDTILPKFCGQNCFHRFNVNAFPIIFQRDSARPYIARLTHNFLRQYGINVLVSPSDL